MPTPSPAATRDAIRTYTRLLEIDPGNALAYENMGVAQLQAQGLPKARRPRCAGRCELDPNLAGAHTALGVVLASTGRKAEAIEAWKRAAALGDPNAADNPRST